MHCQKCYIRLEGQQPRSSQVHLTLHVRGVPAPADCCPFSSSSLQSGPRMEVHKRCCCLATWSLTNACLSPMLALPSGAALQGANRLARCLPCRRDTLTVGAPARSRCCHALTTQWVGLQASALPHDRRSLSGIGDHGQRARVAGHGDRHWRQGALGARDGDRAHLHRAGLRQRLVAVADGTRDLHPNHVSKVCCHNLNQTAMSIDAGIREG